MTLLSPHLDFSSASKHDAPSALPPPGSHLVLSDTLTAPSTFAVHHLAGAAAASNIPVLWVDLRLEGKSSWDAISRKLGAGPPIAHIQPSPLPPALGSPSLFPSGPSLRPTYDAIAAALAPGALVLLDGLSHLLYAGFTPPQVDGLVRAVLALARGRGARLVSTLHADQLPRTDSESSGGGASDELLARVLRGAGGWWRVAGLATGRSGDVSGEISACALQEGGWPSVPRARCLQYRLEAGGVKVFAKGTGRGFL